MVVSVSSSYLQSRLGLKIFTCVRLRSSIENELSTFCIGASMGDVYTSFKPWHSVAFLLELFIVLHDFTLDSNVPPTLSLSSARSCKPILSNDMHFSAGLTKLWCGAHRPTFNISKLHTLKRANNAHCTNKCLIL